MYLAQTFKFRYGEIPDFFYCSYDPSFFVRNIKERVVYFLYIDNQLSGPYKTYWDAEFYNQAFEFYELIHEKKVLVLEPRQVSQEVLKQKIYLRTASFDDIERNTIFFEYNHSGLRGPFALETDISIHDTVLLQKLNDKQLFVINERQNFKL